MLKRGSVAFRTTSCSRASAVTVPVSEASSCAAANRSGSPSRSTSACGRAGSRSAKVIRSKKSRRCAIDPTAPPTPPVPTTRIRTGAASHAGSLRRVEDLTREGIDELLREEIVGRIGCHAGGETYVVPVIYAYDGEAFYAYSIEGKKIRMMRENPSVGFEVDRYEGPGRWRSVIVQGKYEELDGADAERARSLLAEKFADVSRGPRAATEGPAPVAFRIRISEISGRRRGA